MKSYFKRTKKYLGLGIAAVVIFSGIFSFIVPQPKVSAIDSGAWVNANTIKWSGRTFSGPQGPTSEGFYRYVSTDQPSSPPCKSNEKSIIEFKTNPTAADGQPGTGWLDIYTAISSDTCNADFKNDAITLTNVAAAKQTDPAAAKCFTMANPNQTTDCIKKLAEQKCKARYPNWDNDQRSLDTYTACVNQETAQITSGGGSVPPGGVAASAVPPEDEKSDDSEGDPDLDCGTEKSRLDWIVCPVVKLVSSTVGSLDNAIINMLEVDKNVVDEKDAAGGARYYKAWQSFRGIALGILVVAALIMLIGQALGFEILDAYTLKKVMPRLVVAIMGIALSWLLMKWFVLFTNDLGLGVRALIYAPFKEGLGDHAILGGGASVIITLLTVGAILSLKVAGLGFLAGTALLGLAVGIAVLIIRQIVIVLLIMLAPVAIACYVLPNTQNLWKLWYESFTKALFMFPIIMGFLAAGRVFAMVSSGSGVAGDLIAFCAYILPYFLIPATFKFAGGAMRTIGGFTNDRSKGMFDRMRKGRQAAVSKNLHDMKNFSYGNERTKFGRGVNNTIGALANPTSMLSGRKGVQARRRSLHALQGQQTLKEDQIYQANQNDDTFLLAVANKELAKSKLDKDVKKRDTALANLKTAKASGNAADEARYQAEVNSAEASVVARQNGLNTAGQMSMHTRNSRATQMAAFDALTKTGYQFAEGEEGYKEIDSTIQKIVGNDQRSRAQMMDSAQYNIRASGQRFDLGGINHGAEFSAKTGLNKGSLYELANGKAESISQMVQSLPPGNYAAGNLNEDHAVAYHELKAMLPNAKGGNRDAIVKQMSVLENSGIREYMADKSTTPQREIEQYNVAVEQARIASGSAPGGTPYVSTWTPTEISQGWREQNVIRTNGEIAQRKARTYERPDPSRL